MNANPQNQRADNPEIIRATMAGYLAGISDRPDANPYAYIVASAWAWQHGYEQGRLHRIRSTIRDAITPFKDL